MSAWRCSAAIAIALSWALAGAAAAQTPRDKADEINEQGKDLYRKGDLAGAADKFRQAIVLSPEGRFYYNLCVMLDEMGRLNEALTACEAVANNESSQALKDKTAERIAAIKQKVQARGIDTSTGGEGTPTDGNPGDGNPGDGNPGDGNPGDGNPGDGTPAGGNPGNPGRPPPPPPSYPPPPGGDIRAAADPHAYKWALGAEIGVLSNVSIGQQGYFADSGFQLKTHVDFILSDCSHIGVQGYLDVGGLGQGNNDLYTERLSIVDIGGAVFQHRRLTANTQWTPLLGVGVAALEPGSFGDSLVTFGLRAEVALDWMLSPRSVLSLTPMFSFYGPASASSSGVNPAEYGLDKAGSAFALTVGYTFRFSQPFGSSPFIILE